MNIRSPAFERNAPIPARHTCDEEVSPALDGWGVPADAKSMALIVDDPDAPDHAAQLPEGTREGQNDWKRTGYGGLCPPIGRHRYFHELHALDTFLPDLGRPTRDELLKAMDGHVLVQAQLVGTYQRGR